VNKSKAEEADGRLVAALIPSRIALATL